MLWLSPFAKNCNSAVVCGKCSSNHNTNDCNSGILTCINCVNASRALKIELGTNHSAFSSECHVYKRKIELEKHRVDYEFSGIDNHGQ